MITSIEPNVAPTGRYTIAETCAFLGIHRHTLRKYTLEGFIRCGYRRASSRPFYRGSDILSFWRAQL